MAVVSGESIYSLPIVSSYSCLSIDFFRNGAWDMHIRKLLDNGVYEKGKSATESY